MRRENTRFPMAASFVWLILVGLLMVPAVRGQETEDQQESTAEFDTGEVDDMADIDAILEGEEALLSGAEFSYDPGDRRDPFRSLLATVERPALRGPRPEGIPGLLIDEVDLTGILHTSEGWVVQVRAADTGRSELLRVGDQLYDGDVVSIGPDEIVFKQIVNDPTALKPFREVVKKLNP